MSQHELQEHEWKSLNATERDVIESIVVLDEPSGTEIRARLETELGDDVPHFRIYHTLSNLEEKGLVDSRRIDGRTKTHSLTAVGRKAFESHANDILHFSREPQLPER